MTSVPSESKEEESRSHLSELLKVEGKLALREPTGLVMGIAVPIVLLVVFGLIGIASPGNVANTGFTVLDLYVPVIMVFAFIFLGIYILPVTLVRYREMGWLRRVSTTPESPSRLLGAQMSVNLVLALASILIVIFGSESIGGSFINCGDIFSWLGCCGSCSFTVGRNRLDWGAGLSLALPFRSLGSACPSWRAIGDDHVLFSIWCGR